MSVGYFEGYLVIFYFEKRRKRKENKGTLLSLRLGEGPVSWPYLQPDERGFRALGLRPSGGTGDFGQAGALARVRCSPVVGDGSRSSSSSSNANSFLFLATPWNIVSFPLLLMCSSSPPIEIWFWILELLRFRACLDAVGCEVGAPSPWALFVWFLAPSPYWGCGEKIWGLLHWGLNPASSGSI